ncbi:unnamed protein product [Acanthoscelides obtectus]|uniref:Serpin domain-containing protein n=1 Tax=Acanthoscelides obtectus TaxID=200917 RepID=A0A9P0P417_ACAOB|nr:unnamed protein product [Acanthoscelides obtectus]CAK1648394.1 hypothetical protein AOBTE_LOCUS15700 [Acanthoscelides obtectus]
MKGIRVVVVLEIILLTNGNQNCNAEEFYVKHLKYSADVYEFLAGKNKGNFVVSPLSAEILLSLIAEGARGDALSELTDYLGVSSDRYDVILRIVKSLNQSTCDYQIVSVNKVYISNNYEIEATFKNISLLIYNTTVETVDFRKAHEVSKVINQWVEDQTNHKIHNLIHSNELDAATIILVNVIYFSASWARPFRYKHTSPAKFYVSNGKR